MENTKCLDKRLVHKGHIVDFYEMDMESTDGVKMTWDFISHKGAACVVAVDNDGKLIMVKQYRPGCDRVTLEIPAGCLNPGEDRMTAAARELEEETGKKCHHIEKLLNYYPAPAYDSEYIEIFLAKDFTDSKQNLDEGEELEIYKYDLSELVSMILDGTIADGKTIAGILAYKVKIENEK